MVSSLSDYAIAMQKIKAAKEWSNNAPSMVFVCDVLEILCRNLDKEERCGCVSNYIKGKCPYCECPTCHQKIGVPSVADPAGLGGCTRRKCWRENW